MNQTEQDVASVAYAAGKDAGLNGPNEVNCHFRWFAKPEWTKAWEQGKAEGDRLKAEQVNA